ncbi:hypothetical protein [Micromonospora sp. NPDC002575]|uniref:hypothetical protein n=1 Tax=Micromonospora sp. NPDC002575 TaxID=3364222 RepID=UPI0036C6C9DB
MAHEVADRVLAGTAPDLRRRVSRLTWLIQLHPVTILVLAPYAILVVPMAVAHDNPETGFIVMLLGLALTGTIVGEVVVRGRRRTRGQWQRELEHANAGHPRLFLLARLVAVVSIAADLVGTLYGRGTIFTQLTGEAARSPVALVSSLFTGWRYVALALLVASLVGGHARRSAFLRWTAALVGIQVVLVLVTAISEPMIAYLSFVVAVTAICGVLRPRHVVIVAAVLFLAWPTLYAVRNEIRADGGVHVAEEVTAAERLRFDLQVTLAADYDVPVDLNQPGPAEILRYGLVPRLLDPGRPPLSTGAAINDYLFGISTSSYTFLPVGTVYFLDGRRGVVLFYAFWAMVVGILLRVRGGPGPVRLSCLALVVGGPLGWTSAYPDAMIGLIQHMVAASPLLLLIRLTRGSTAGRGPVTVGRLPA